MQYRKYSIISNDPSRGKTWLDPYHVYNFQHKLHKNRGGMSSLRTPPMPALETVIKNVVIKIRFSFNIVYTWLVLPEYYKKKLLAGNLGLR